MSNENRLVLTLIDRDNEITGIVLDRQTPALTDEYGHPTIDFDTHPFVQSWKPGLAEADDNPSLTKTFLNAFLLKPSPGLPSAWLESEDPEVFEAHMDAFLEAMNLLTGKQVIGVHKYEKGDNEWPSLEVE